MMAPPVVVHACGWSRGVARLVRTFAPTMALVQIMYAACAFAQPTVFWLSDPVAPDETVLITGSELDSVKTASVSRIPDGLPDAEPDLPRTVAVLQRNPQSLKIIVPKELAPGAYRIELSHDEGVVSATVNLPTVYWTQGDLGDAVSPGGVIQVFGRNIVRRTDRARLLMLPDRAATPVTATLREGDLWHASFAIPDDLAAGTYRLRLFNGDGGDGGWIDAGHIDVHKPSPEPQRRLDVRAFGAVGDGIVDCTRAVRAALDEASRSGGGTVYFARGRYLLSEALVIPPGVSIKGESTETVNLFWPDLAEPPEALVQGSTRFSLEDVTLYASNHRHVVSGGFLSGDAAVPNASDIAIRRVRIRASAFRGVIDLDTVHRRVTDYRKRYPRGGPDSIRLSGDRLTVSDCDVVGSGRSLYLFNASNVVVSGNILTNGKMGWYSFTGSRRIIFQNNLVTTIDLQGAGGSINTISNWVNSSENVFMGRNTFKAIYGEDREAIATDGPGGYYFGHAESVQADRLSLLGALNEHPLGPSWQGAAVMVVHGRGAGQFARVAAFDRGAVPHPVVRLDRPLQVGLDATSMVTIAPMRQNYLIVGNLIEDAGIGAQSFGIALNHVFAGNQSIRTSGFFAIGLDYLHFQPSWQVQFLDNRIVEGNVYRAGPQREALSREAAVGVLAFQATKQPDQPPLARAIIIRRNQLERDAHIEIKGYSPASPGVRDVIIEDNAIAASRVGLSVDKGVAWWLARRNEINRIQR